MAEGYAEEDIWNYLADSGFITTMFGTAYDWTKLSITPMPPNTETGLYDSFDDIRHQRFRRAIA